MGLTVICYVTSSVTKIELETEDPKILDFQRKITYINCLNLYIRIAGEATCGFCC